MIVYRDMTFCQYYDSCKNAEDCPRPLTIIVKEVAAQHGLPIAVFSDKPDCHEKKDEPSA